MPNNFPVPFFVPSPVLSGLSIAYKNADFIADVVAPRVQVAVPTFAYTMFNKIDFFTIPDTRTSRTGIVNQVSWSSTSGTAAVEEHALEEVVPKLDQAVAEAYGAQMPDPKLIAVQQVTALMDLAHEKRVADLYYTAANYAAANKTTLTGTAQWSDYTNSDPFAAIVAQIQLGALNGVSYNTLILGQVVWNVVRRHPKLVYAAYGTSGGLTVTEQYLADQLGIDRVIIGSSRANLANKGQTANIQQLWGKNAVLAYIAPATLNTDTPTFAVTAQWGTRVASEHFNIDAGWRGSDVVRVGEAHKELILAPDYGFLFQNVIA